MSSQPRSSRKLPVRIDDAQLRAALTDILQFHQSSAPQNEAPRFISREQVLERVGCSYACLWGWIRQGKFPAARELSGPGRRTRVGWLESEVNHWMLGRPRRLPKGSTDEYKAPLCGERR